MRETWIWSLGREDPLEKEMATRSSTLAWRIPRTGEAGGLQSRGSQRVRLELVTKQQQSCRCCCCCWVASVVSDSGRPHRRQPARLLCPRDSAESLQSCPTLCDPIDRSPPGSSVHGILQARTGEGCHFLLQGIFLTQGSHPHLLSPALAGRFFTIEPQVLKLQLITLSRDERAGSDVVDIAFFGPHTHTHTHSHTHTHTQAPNTPQSSWQFPALPVLWSPLFFTDKGFPVGDFSWGRVKTDIYSQGLLVSKKTYPMKQSFNLYFTYLYIKLLRNPLNPTEC